MSAPFVSDPAGVVTAPEIAAAQRTLGAAIRRTPTIHSALLSERLGVDLHLKLELQQHTGSFKARGAFTHLLALDEARKNAGVTCVSAGNHAAAVAYAAMRLGSSAKVVMFHTASPTRIAQCKQYRAEVVLAGSASQAFDLVRRIEAEGVTLLCGAPAVISMVLEAAADWDGPIPGDGQVRVVVAGAPPPTSVIESVETELGWEFIQLYGLTETSPLLTFNRSPDIPFDRSLNAYRGCEHGCIYCFARPTHAYHDLSPGLDFETRLFAKPDAARLLREDSHALLASSRVSPQKQAKAMRMR